VDIMSPEKRSALMSRIRAKDTRPEYAVRKIAHSLGYRYRLHVKELPGTPDLVFRRFRKVVFVNGCFWHRHNCRQGRSFPKTNREFWTTKFQENRKRDKKKRAELRRLGWDVLVLWQCQCCEESVMADKLERFLQDKP
jgi:DNA mismatch endonuclease (patch repair protein)